MVIAAMVKIAENSKLEKLGWKLLLQIHDELILEGPQENAQEAILIIKNIMENPLE